MQLPRRFAAFALTVALLPGCALAPDAPPGGVGPVATPTAGDPWMAEVSARIRDAAHAFEADGEAFVSASPETGITGRFDAGGAVLTRGDDDIAVRTTHWGRAGALDAVSVATPGPGRCVPERQDPSGRCIARLAYAEAGLTEWWAAGPEGFEQGWTVAAPPAGADRLVIDVEVDGASGALADSDLLLHGAGGEAWVVSGLRAWDAGGAPLDARFVVTDGGFRVTIHDAGARYPIEIDPVFGTAGTIVQGAADGQSTGYSVSGAGDVNGDGYGDVIVGAFGYEGNTGRAYVFDGSAGGVSSTATTTLTGEARSSAFGASVSGAGDVNGDGYDDVIVGAYSYGSRMGRAYVYAGSPAGVSSTATTTLTGAASEDRFGVSVSGAGDTNGDGYDDVIVGDYGYSSGAGLAHVYAGSASGVSTSAATTLTGTADYYGHSVSGAGDVNGDGYGDVIVGAYGYGPGQGRAYVYLGSAGGVSSTRESVPVTF